MLKQRLNLKMEHYLSSGLVLTLEEQLLLQVSLPVLQAESKFLVIAFWGKVFGTDNDYYIAQGRGKDYIRNKMSFYSTDCKKWNLLFPPAKEVLSKYHLIRGRFKGEPSERHRFYDVTEDGLMPEKKSSIQEEKRLSALVKLVDYETDIAPKRALILTPQGVVAPNESFRGLSKDEAGQLTSYDHVRLPDSDVDLAPTTLLCPEGGDRALDFLEPVSKDYPPGCWTLQCDALGEVATLRNLWWPGHTFYHVADTKEYSRIYMGYGDRNDDLPFML